MFRRFTAGARDAVARAQDEARRLGHGHVGTEHLLLGLLHDPASDAGSALLEFDVTVDEARVQVERLFGRGGGGTSGALPFTPRAKRALEHALRESLAREDDVIGPEHVLLGLVAEPSGGAARILADFDVDKHSVRATVARRRAADGDVEIASDFLQPSHPFEGEDEILIEIPRETGRGAARLPLLLAIALAALSFPLGLLTGFLIWG